MFKGYWRHIVAAGLILLGTCLFGSEVQSKQANHKPASETKDTPRPPISIGVVNFVHGPPGTTDIDPDRCEDAKDNKQDSFCVEWRSMKATEKSANWTKYTAIIGLIGTVAVGVSLIFSSRANKVAAEALKISLLQSRPWVRLDVRREGLLAYRDNPPHGADATIHITVENIGPTPAVEFIIRHEFLRFNDRDELLESLKHRSRMGGSDVIFPERQNETTHEIHMRDELLMLDHRAEIGLLVVAVYKVAENDKIRRTPLYFRVNVNWDAAGDQVAGFRHASMTLEPYTKHNLHPT